MFGHSFDLHKRNLEIYVIIFDEENDKYHIVLVFLRLKNLSYPISKIGFLRSELVPERAIEEKQKRAGFAAFLDMTPLHQFKG